MDVTLERSAMQRRRPGSPPACLDRGTREGQKGGTLIEEAVFDLETHERRLRDPNAYRPRACARCGKSKLHVHDYRHRVLLGDAKRPETRIVRYRCFNCGAVWQILPALLARCLWRSWRVVEQETICRAASRVRSKVPHRTVRRWRGRLETDARALIESIHESSRQDLRTTPGDYSNVATRAELVLSVAQRLAIPEGRRLAVSAAILHRVAHGKRLA